MSQALQGSFKELSLSEVRTFSTWSSLGKTLEGGFFSIAAVVMVQITIESPWLNAFK